MLLPDDIHPEQTVYFNGALVIEALQKLKSAKVVDLYIETTQRNPMSAPLFVLCLDWLYLIDAVTLDPDGMITLCI